MCNIKPTISIGSKHCRVLSQGGKSLYNKINYTIKTRFENMKLLNKLVNVSPSYSHTQMPSQKLFAKRKIIRSSYKERYLTTENIKIFKALSSTKPSISFYEMTQHNTQMQKYSAIHAKHSKGIIKLDPLVIKSLMSHPPSYVMYFKQNSNPISNGSTIISDANSRLIYNEETKTYSLKTTGYIRRFKTLQNSIDYD